MVEPEIKNKSRNFGKEFDLNSQEIEKTNYFLAECELKDFSELVYLSSSINKKYTALLYREKDHSYLYLFVLKHIIDKEKENISYKIKTKLKFNKNEIDKINLEDKQMFIDDQANKNAYNEYSITLINKDLILLQVVGKKIMIVNFDKKEFTVLFCNTSDKKSIQVVSTYDELIVTKKDNMKKYQIRTYIFCISSGKLYFFMVNEKVFSDYQFLLIPFPFGEDYSDCIDFEILKITNKNKISDNSDIVENKYYFLFIALLNGKFIRYITEWVSCGLKDILLNFNSNLEKNIIKKNVDYFDKGNNNCGLKVYRSEKCASFIILQIGFHIFTFKYHETDSPEEMMKRFGVSNNNLYNNVSNNNLDNNISNNNTTMNNSPNNNNMQTPIKNEGEVSDSNSLKNSGKNNNNNTIISKLNESLSLSKSSLFQQKARHSSLANINYPQISKNSPKTSSSTNNVRNNQVSSESIMTSNKHIPTLDHTESNITFNDLKDNIKDPNLITKNISLDMKSNSFPEFKTKDKGVVYYSLEKFYDLNNNKENIEYEENVKNSKENINEENSKSNDSYISQSKNIIYSFTYHSFISFIQTTNNVIVCHYPDKDKEIEGEIEKVMKSSKLTLSNDKIEILDVLHYYELKYSFLLTNKNIFKFRVNTDLIHLLNISTKHKNISSLNDKKKDSLYYKLKGIFRYSRNNKIPSGGKCRLCKKKDSKIICPKCKRAIYCTVEHMHDDFKNIHFFQCEMNLCIEKLEKDRKKNHNLTEINNIIISFKNILNQIFVFIENKKDYINYTVFLKIMLNILVYINLESSINKALSPLRTKISNDYRDICDKIFLIELWFFYCNLNILYITYTIKSGNYFLATHLLNLVKIIDLIEKKDTKLQTMFAYFSLANDLTKYKINNRGEIEKYTKDFFFDLLEVYTNENRNGQYLYIHEQFFIYYLHTFSSLLKIHLFLKEKTKTMKGIGTINIDKIVYFTPKLFEDKFNSTETNDISQSPVKLPLILCYYYLSFILVKIDKITTAIYLLRYILSEMNRINSHKDNKTSSVIVSRYSSLEAKIYLNIGILMNYNGDFNLGINHLENCYRLCFQEKLSVYLTMKVLEMLCLAYINHDKIDTAFILVKNAISLRKKFLSENKKKFNTTILIYKLNLFKLKIYLLFIYQYTSFKYQKMNNFLNAKSIKSNNKIIKNPDDIPSSITPTVFNKVSPALIGYISEEDKRKKNVEFLKNKMNKDEDNFKFELDSNLDKFVLFCYTGKLEMIIKALEFLYKLSEKEYETLNNDNGSTQKEETKDENYNLRERSSSISRDFSMSYSKPVGYKEKLNFLFKEDNQTFLDEIEVKMGLYEQLSDSQQKELKTIENNIFRRSILLRDPKGRIDKFNLNYHPKYTLEFFELFSKLNETVFLNQLEKFGVGEQYEARIFDHKQDGLIYSLRKYLNLDKIQNILYLQKVKLFEKYKQKLILVQKTEYKETVTKNQLVANEYINKLKEKFSKDKFLKNMNLEGLYEKLVNELTNNELNCILDNPNKILNYIYINSKTFPDYLNKTERLFNKEDTKRTSGGNSERTTNIKRPKRIPEKDNGENENNNIDKDKEKNKENNNQNNENIKKEKLSPRAIYNNLIDLISEKRNERTGSKKRTVNFKNVIISNILDYVENKEKKNLNQNDIKKAKRNTSKNWYRSVSLNKSKQNDKDNKDNKDKKDNDQKRNIAKSTNYSNNFRKESKFKVNSNATGNGTPSNINRESKFVKKNIDNKSIRKTSVNSLNVKYSKRNTNIGNNIDDKILNNLNYNKRNKNDNNEHENSFMTIKSNRQRKKYERNPKKQTFIFEENLSQQKIEKTRNDKRQNSTKSANKNNNPINNTNNNTNEVNIKSNEKGKKKYFRKSIILNKDKFMNYENNKMKNNEDNQKSKSQISKKIEKTPIKEKNEIQKKETNKSAENMKKTKNEETKNHKTYVQRQKPSFREFKERVLHKNVGSYSALY